MVRHSSGDTLAQDRCAATMKYINRVMTDDGVRVEDGGDDAYNNSDCDDDENRDDEHGLHDANESKGDLVGDEQGKRRRCRPPTVS